MTLDNITISLDTTNDLNLSLDSTNDLNLSLETPVPLTFQLDQGNSEGVRDYESLLNKPSIQNVVLIGNKNFEDLGLNPISANDLLEILS